VLGRAGDLDEPTAGLDLSVQPRCCLLRPAGGSHTYRSSSRLSVVRRLCDRVAIMYLGRIVETA
jgi:ABC-type dipeptide/oligopeptide/nickel transport system ATPase component